MTREEHDGEDHDENNCMDEQQSEKDFKVCEGLTDEERRQIRKSQRLLRNEICDIDVSEARDKNNQIYKRVRYIRESVLDAENLDEIAKKAASKVDQMVQVGSSSSFLSFLLTVACY